MPKKEIKINKSYFQLKKNSQMDEVDDVTAEDLNLNEYFAGINTTETTPGESVLYSWMRNQVRSESQLNDRKSLVGFFREYRETGIKIQKILKKVSKQHYGDVAAEIWGDPGDKYLKYKTAFRVYYYSMLTAILMSVIAGVSPVFFILAFIVINLIIHYRSNLYIRQHADSIFYFMKMLRAVKRTGRLFKNSTGIGIIDSIPEQAKLSKKLPKQMSFFGSGVNVTGDLMDIIIDYYRIFLLGEVSAYFRFYSAFKKHFSEFEKIYITLGSIDAALALGRIDPESICRPEFAESEKPAISARDMKHPLVDNCTGNNFDFGKNLIITGTNMSGKSTFLRTIGINQVLATTLGFCYADEFKTGFFPIYTAIQINDDLNQEKSRYLVEAERLLFILEKCRKRKTISLIDEILTGTNSSDRIAASIMILKYLDTTDSFITATTHDIEIAEAVSSIYDTFYFTEDIKKGDLQFNYKLNKGIIDKKNAINILKHIGFEKYISL